MAEPNDDDSTSRPVDPGRIRTQNEERARREVYERIGDIHFDEAGIDKLITQVERAKDRLDKMKPNIDRLRRVDGGYEDASQRFAAAARGLADRYEEFHDKHVEAYRKYIDRLKEMKQNYHQHEQDVADDLRGRDA